MASLVAFVFSFLCLISLRLALASNGGFSVELIPRDSPKSPLYNPQETAVQRIQNAFRRSANRVAHFSPLSRSVSTQEVESPVTNNQGEYLMSISVGTPAFEVLAIADTGSDLIWTQCKPCKDCYKQTAPLFDPKSSRTYRDLSCQARQCQSLDYSSCSSGSSPVCLYSYSYGDQSYTYGNVAADTITLGSTSGRPVAFPKTIFGCGHNNAGTFSEQSSGIVGLGGGSISLISQLSEEINGKFSYCLVPFSPQGLNSSSTLNFGDNAILKGSGVQTTPLIPKSPDTFYFLTLEAISVGLNKISFPGSSFGTTEGNIIIDSGTTLTLLPSDFFQELATAVDKVVGAEKVEDPTGFLNLCYSAQSNLNVPIITAHFTGADVKLSPVNTFVQVSDDVVCFAFNPIEDGAIFGNLSQANFLVAYDLEAKTVSFKPTDCNKLKYGY